MYAAGSFSSGDYALYMIDYLAVSSRCPIRWQQPAGCRLPAVHITRISSFSWHQHHNVMLDASLNIVSKRNAIIYRALESWPEPAGSNTQLLL